MVDKTGAVQSTTERIQNIGSDGLCEVMGCESDLDKEGNIERQRLFKKIFIFWESTAGEGQREWGTADLKQALCGQADRSEPDVGLELTSCEIMT